MAPAPAPRKSGIDFKNPGGKEFAIVGGGVLALALVYFWWKKRQAANTGTAANNAAGATSPTGFLMSWMHDHQSSSTGGSGSTVVVPNVVGFTDTAADAAIKAVGLKVSDGNEPAGGFGNNGTTKVKSQSPAGNTAVAPGSTVTLTFVTGAKKKAPAGKGDKGDG